MTSSPVNKTDQTTVVTYREVFGLYFIYIHKGRMSISDWSIGLSSYPRRRTPPLAGAERDKQNAVARPCVEALPPSDWLRPSPTCVVRGRAGGRYQEFRLLCMRGRTRGQCEPGALHPLEPRGLWLRVCTINEHQNTKRREKKKA